MTTEPETPPVTPSWFIDDNVPGVGDRPTWLNEKFKTAADMAKSHQELEKKLGSVPDDYDMTKSKFLDPDYVPFQDLLQLAKEKRVPKEVMDKMVDSIDKYMDEFSIDYEEEAKALGENAKERLTTLDNWAKANLSEDSYNALTSKLNDRHGIKALEELRGKMMSNTPMVPAGNEAANTAVASLDEMKSELVNNLAKYKSDPGYRKDYEGRLTLAAKNSGMIDKVGA